MRKGVLCEMISLFDKDAGVILPPALLHGAALTNPPFFSSENNSVSELQSKPKGCGFQFFK
jgi:hypothetical protein